MDHSPQITLSDRQSRSERREKMSKLEADLAVEDAKPGKQKKKQTAKSEARARSNARDKKETDWDS
jgi:hypothetical protein